MRTVASRGAHVAPIEVFPESDFQAVIWNLCISQSSLEEGAGTGVSQSRNGNAQA